MVRILPKTRQIMVEPEEVEDLRAEIIEAFLALDEETDGRYYSGKNMKEKYPKLSEILQLI